MIKVSMFYPNGGGATFDMDYYVKIHMPLVFERCSPGIRGMSVDRGISGGGPGEQAPYAAIGHLLFDSVEDFQSSFGPHTKEITGDIANYTRIDPLIQISEVTLQE